MLGRFFALDPAFSCDHGPGMGCNKCKWKQRRKKPPIVLITLVQPEEPDKEAYQVINDFEQARIMPNSPW